MRKTRFWQSVRCAFLAVALIVGLALPAPPGTMAAPAEQVTPVTWFFAEGSTDRPFDTWFLIENPTSGPANVTFTFQPAGGGNVTVRNFVVGPTSRFSLFANQILPPSGFSTRIDSDRLVFAERAMYVGFDGHVVTGIPSANRTWLFAEGSTDVPFHTWLLLQNPNNQVVTATITYLLAVGAPRTQIVNLPPTSRTSIFVNDVLPNAGFSTRVEATLPIVVERAMYRFPGNAATGVSGVNTPSLKWFFAEGNSQANIDTWLLLQNPNTTPVTVSVSLLTEAGGIVSFLQPMAPTSRQSVFLDQVLPNASFSISLEASAPVVAERAMYFGTEPRGAHATQGATEQATVWQLAEGSTAPPFDEVITVLNTNIEETTFLRFEFFLPDGSVVVREIGIGPLRKFLLRVDDILPNVGVSTRVSGSRPIVVERTMFISKLGSLGATNTIGIKSP